MKNITIRDQECQLKKDDISSLEQKLGVSLPSDYKEFLLIHNGGHPNKNCYDLLTADDASDVSCFYAFYDGNLNNIIIETDRLSDRAPKGFIAIGDDSGGNWLCLGCEGNHYGKVYWWFHEEEADEGEEPTMSNMYLIANSFANFINCLYRGYAERHKEKNFICFDIHDRYSLPLSQIARKYGTIVTGFFAQATVATEDFVIERPDTVDDITLYYDDKEKSIRHKRTT